MIMPGINLADEPVPANQTLRVISMAPNLTESVFEIGAGDTLVGVTDFCRYPPEALLRRRCGGWSNPDFEVVSRLEPDLILIQGQHQAVHEFADRRGIRLCSILMDDVESIREGMIELGEILGYEDGATSAVKKFEYRLSVIQSALESNHAGTRPRVFLSLSRREGSLSGIMTMASGSFMDQALQFAGGENVFSDLKQPYPQVSQESLIKRSPEYIIEIRGDALVREELKNGLIEDWSVLSSLPAVMHDRIHVLNANYLMIPGPRFPLTVQLIYDALHGDKSDVPGPY
jgi:iron complex transport system substrate-binding protein